MTSVEFENAKTVDVNGTTLAYCELGEGEPVIFAHGALSDQRIWRAQQEALSREYRAIAYSCRHHGPTTPAPPGTELGFATHVDDLQALVTKIGAAPAHLVGNSSGGLLCLLLAMRAPELVRSLILLEPFMVPVLVGIPPRPMALIKLALRHPRTAAAIVHFGARGLAPSQAAFDRGDLERGFQLFARAVLGANGLDRMPEARMQQARDNLGVFAAQLSGAAFPPVNSDDVRRIQAPTLLIGGDQSPLIMQLFMDRIHELLPHADRVTIPGASHDIQVDEPSAVTEAVLTFLARGPAKPLTGV